MEMVGYLMRYARRSREMKEMYFTVTCQLPPGDKTDPCDVASGFAENIVREIYQRLTENGGIPGIHDIGVDFEFSAEESKSFEEYGHEAILPKEVERLG